MKVIIFEGATYHLGTNSNDNWEILDKSKQNWIWFHVNKFPSGYVILQESLNNLKKNNHQICGGRTGNHIAGILLVPR